jgi:hypothetical protein
MNHNYFLMFTLEPYATTNLIGGRLLLMEGAAVRERFNATSGLPGWQQRGDYDQVARGPIPRPDLVGIQYYEVTTVADYVTPAEQPGIAGNFYAITPSEVNVAGVTRGLFGVHRDANVPGTNGCVGLTTTVGWEAFQKWMLTLNKQGILSLPLQVDYPI